MNKKNHDASCTFNYRAGSYLYNAYNTRSTKNLLCCALINVLNYTDVDDGNEDDLETAIINPVSAHALLVGVFP